MDHPLKRWNLKSVYNMRDIGGYACEGGTVRYGKLLRSDYIGRLSEEEKEFLIGKGLADVIDLRREIEQEELPNPFSGGGKVKFHNFAPPPIGDIANNRFEDFACMGEDYVWRVDNYGSYYVDIMDAIINSEGIVLFHCHAGKDRTGIVAALILLSLGVDERDVIADYQVSGTYLKKQTEEECLKYPDLPRFIWESEAVSMEMFITHLNDKYGGALEYLKSRGLSDAQYEKLRERLVEAEVKFL